MSAWFAIGLDSLRHNATPFRRPSMSKSDKCRSCMKQCKFGSAYDDASPDSAVYIFRFDLSSLRRLSAIRLHDISGGKRTWKTFIYS